MIYRNITMRSLLFLGVLLLVTSFFYLGSKQTAFAFDEKSYLTNLALAQGHLFVGLTLYRQGASDHAKTHMKHPEDELYTDLLPAFNEKGIKGFDASLKILTLAVEYDSAQEVVYEAFRLVDSEIERVRKVVEADKKTQMEVITQLLMAAAEEYEVSIQDGLVVDHHEYQDAYGFTQIARTLLYRLTLQACGTEAFSTEAFRELQALQEDFKHLDSAWPSLVPQQKIGDLGIVLFKHTIARTEAAAACNSQS